MAASWRERVATGRLKMLPDPVWTSYLAARGTALSCAGPGVAATAAGRAEARLQAYWGMGHPQAQAHARRCFLHASDQAFHDQLLASGSTDLLRAIVSQTSADDLPLVRERARG